MARYKIDYSTGEQEIIEASRFWPSENGYYVTFLRDTGIEPSLENGWEDRHQPFIYVCNVRRVEIIT